MEKIISDTKNGELSIEEAINTVKEAYEIKLDSATRIKNWENICKLYHERNEILIKLCENL